jgi:hypothetical protein
LKPLLDFKEPIETPQVLVGVMSAFANTDRRDAVRATWMRFRHPHLRFKAVFVIGVWPLSPRTRYGLRYM